MPTNTHRRLLYTVPVDVWAILTRMAEQEGKSLPDYVASLLEQHAAQITR